MELYRDTLADVTDEDLRQLHTERLQISSSHFDDDEKKPHDYFRYSQYDWSGFDPDYVVLPLTGDFFTIIEKEDLARAKMLTGLYACVSLNPFGEIVKVRAVGRHGGRKGKKWYLHRFLAKAKPLQIVDHWNRWPLDNRRKANLRLKTQGANLANAMNSRGKFPRGVEPRGNKFGARIKFDGDQIRSECMDTEEEAHAWYLQKYQEFYGHVDEKGEAMERDLPVLPPSKNKRFPMMSAGMVVQDLAATF